MRRQHQEVAARARSRTRAISEAGRKFLADLLAQLSDKQITDMFTAARVDRFHRHAERNPPISEWVRVFKKKRDEIAGARCPS